MADMIKYSEFMSLLQDPEVDEKSLRPYFCIDKVRSQSFAPLMAINWESVDAEGLEADVAVGSLNRISRKNRQRRYRRRIKDQPDAIRIVSEGDSWFQYPWILDDVVDQLFDRYAIYSLGAAGDLLSEMAYQDELLEAVNDQSPQLVMLSGGGNDLLGNKRLAAVLHPYDKSRHARDYPNERFNDLLVRIGEQYRRIIRRLVNEFPKIRVLCHSYDWAIPQQDGKWLGKPMESINIKDKSLMKAIVRVLIDQFDCTLRGVVREFEGNLHRVDCRGAVSSDQWYDELHPNDKGFAVVAGRFAAAIELLTGGSDGRPSRAIRLCPGIERRVRNTCDLDESSFRRIVARRTRALIGAEADLDAPDSKRKQWEADISRFFEKVHRGSDFLPAQYLEDGAERAKAVCRISTPTGFGTGFLVASHQYIMTNNHVLPNPETAEESVAEFDFVVGQQSRRVGLEPDRLFITDEPLDFTIVACNVGAVDNVTPIPLLRNPATVTRNERVSIIQHPRGRHKEIAIHDNKVIRILDKVVHYLTDTEPGSSGSPVFNNGWDLVALHHAGWSEGRASATNEGIRMSAIVSNLAARRRRGGVGAREAAMLLDRVPDSSPLLGFFDLDGAAEKDSSEVEIPDFRGSSDFADIGFWNIEHFNASVSNERIELVGDVIERLSMDVMGLVEVERPALERLARALRKRGMALGFEVLDVRGRQDLAVIFDQDTSTVILDEEIAQDHRRLLDVTTSSGRRAFPRDPLFAHCKVNDEDANPIEFLLIVVHFKAFGDAQSRQRRRLAANALAKIIAKERENTQLPIILGGDFNELLNNDVLSALTDAPDLFAMTADDASAGAASYVGSPHQSLIDHILISRDVRPGSILGDDAAIVRLDRSIQSFADRASDHVPVVMRVVLRPSPISITERATEIPTVDVAIPADADTLIVRVNRGGQS